MSKKRVLRNSSNKRNSYLLNPFFQFIAISLISIVILLVIVSINDVSIFFEKWTTIILNRLLLLFHFKTRMTGNIIMLLDGSQIKFQIIPDCTGIYPFIILFSLMVGFPTKLIKKISGISLAFIATFLFNYARLLLLFVIGRSSASWFDIAHLFIWQVSFVLYIVIFFIGWIQWVKTK